SLSYNNFTFGENDLQKPLEQKIKVANIIRALTFTLVIRVPVKLGDKDIWADTSSFQIADCQRGADEPPVATDFAAKIKEKKILLLRGEPKAFPGQQRDIVPPACPGPSPWFSSRWDLPETPPEKGIQESSGLDAQATSTGSSRCGGAAALL
ncbi:hypothetical protein ATANTOWER_030837, partial [Ataeniobius toweri]|nr:hypothetical protein [Ataeniobius toweri]